MSTSYSFNRIENSFSLPGCLLFEYSYTSNLVYYSFIMRLAPWPLARASLCTRPRTTANFSSIQCRSRSGGLIVFSNSHALDKNREFKKSCSSVRLPVGATSTLSQASVPPWCWCLGRGLHSPQRFLDRWSPSRTSTSHGALD